jgi:hypothetical protein
VAACDELRERARAVLSSEACRAAFNARFARSEVARTAAEVDAARDAVTLAERYYERATTEDQRAAAEAEKVRRSLPTDAARAVFDALAAVTS